MSSDPPSALSEGLKIIAGYCTWLATLPEAKYVFRGHADSEWRLLPSAAPERKSAAATITSQNDLNKWKKLAGPVTHPPPISEIAWLVLAQHYSVPTPLLDWTNSPLAALFFACREQDELLAHVYALPVAPFAEYDSLLLIDPFSAGERELVLLPTDALNPRAIAQRSMMTLHRPASTDPWRVIDERTGEHLGRRIKFFPVPAKSKRATILALDLLGFNGVTMMPDVHSAAQVFRDSAS